MSKKTLEISRVITIVRVKPYDDRYDLVSSRDFISLEEKDKFKNLEICRVEFETYSKDGQRIKMLNVKKLGSLV
jgi:hypothetical protein